MPTNDTTQWVYDPRRIDSFCKRLDMSSRDSCWEWQGSRYAKGYGCTSYKGRKLHAHRLAWILARGAIPDGMMVCHTCDNPPCCNPNHLFLGTNSDNVRDSIGKGRRDQRGECNNCAKLTSTQVLAIRRSHENKSALARMFGVSRRAIQLIKNHQTWSHLPCEWCGSEEPARDIPLDAGGFYCGCCGNPVEN